MQFEGEHKVIPIKGISRAGADSICEDGAMNEVIGLEYKDGSYVPYTNYPSVEGEAGKEGHKTLPATTTFAYIHKTNTQTNIILITEGKIAWGDYSIKDDYKPYDTTTFESVADPLSVHAIGEMLIVSSKTGLSYWLFNGTTKTYDLYQDENIESNLPKVSLQVSYIDNEHPMKGKYNDGQLLCARSTDPTQSTSNIVFITGQTVGTTYTVSLGEDSYSIIADTAVKARSMVLEKGRLVDYHLAVVAYRLKTGEYVYASAPLLLGKPRNENNKPINGTDNIFYAPEDEDWQSYAFSSEPHHFGQPRKYWDAFECTISSGTVRQAGGGYYFLGDAAKQKIGASYSLPTLFGYYREPGSSSGLDTIEKSFVVCANGNVLKYHINKTIDKKYRNLIDCCCIFLSEPISPYKDFSSENIIATERTPLIKDGRTYYTMGYGFSLKEEDEILSDIKEIQNFYKVKEIPFADIVESGKDEYIYIDLVGKLGDNLLLQETLPLSAFDHSRVISADMTSYNSRLHLTNYKKKIYSGFKLSDFVLTGGNGQYTQASYSSTAIEAKLYIRTLIKSIDGDSEVWSIESLSSSSLTELVDIPNRYNPIISYPDANAYKMEIYIETTQRSSNPDSGTTAGGTTIDTTTQTAESVTTIDTATQAVSSGDTVASSLTTKLIKCCTIDLAPSRNGGFAYGVFATAMYTPSDATVEEERLLSYFDFKANSIEVTKLSGNQEGVNTSILCRNQIKISDTYVPNYFPNTGIVTVGDGEIIGLVKLSIALSQDTFGRYPLLVFCSDGIYSMQTSDTGSYSSVAPFSREVCINKKTICEVDGAVLFASSKGLMMATSSGVEEFCPMLNGKPRHLPKEDRDKNGLGLELYNKVVNSDYSTQLSKFIEEVDFRDYLSLDDTVVTYASEKNKIIVYNPEKKYIYWIDIQTRNTTQLPIQIRLDDNNYPTENYFLYQNNSSSAQNILSTSLVQDLTAIEGASDYGIQTLLQSRPIKLSSGLKASIRVVLRGYFKSVLKDESEKLQDKYGVLLVLGSIDGVNWQPIGYTEREISNGGTHDIGCVTDRVSYNYLMYIFTATLSVDSHIDSIEMSVYDKYNNKLR